MRSTSALNSSIVIGILEGLRTCWILCIAHVPAALPFMYDRMNSIWLMSQTALGCVTRHTRHASVTHFRPISGNIVEVTLVTPPIMYINSHAKETYFP